MDETKREKLKKSGWQIGNAEEFLHLTLGEIQMKFENPDGVVAKALRHIAWKMCDNPNEYTVEEGKMIDRALRSCRGIIDIDVVWVQWRYQADLYGWSTDDELRSNGRGYRYPINATKDNE